MSAAVGVGPLFAVSPESVSAVGVTPAAKVTGPLLVGYAGGVVVDSGSPDWPR